MPPSVFPKHCHQYRPDKLAFRLRLSPSAYHRYLHLPRNPGWEATYTVTGFSRQTPTPSHLRNTARKAFSKHLETKQANLGSWTTALLIGLLGGLLLTLSASPLRQPHQDQQSPPSPNALAATTETRDEANMTGELQSGRPGTLTPEQEEKLRQFWIASARILGIIDDKFLEELSASKTNGAVASDAKQKSQKRRLGLFSRKHKTTDSDVDSTTSTESAERMRAVSVTEDDKYGQTKQFYDTISQQSPESLRQTIWSMVKHDHPDALLLRFLRARRWDVDKALIMMISTMNWRAKEAHVDDDVMFNGEAGAVEVSETKDEEAIKRGSGEDFMAQLRMGKSFFHGKDELGRPVCYVRARLHRAGEHSQISLERATFFQIETARMMLAPPVDTATILFDLTGFSLANMDYAPVKFMIKCFEANYPESLGVVLVHRAPWVFQGVWKIIKGWLDPVVASKVHFTNDTSDLQKFIDIKRIPKTFGGEEEWEYQYLEPVVGENDRMKDSATREKLLKEREAVYKRYQDASIEWIVAVEKAGSTEEIEEIKQRRNNIARELRDGYWKLDPYIRARSFYDRSGVLKEGGIVDYYPKTTGGKPAVKPADKGTTSSSIEETGVSVPAEETKVATSVPVEEKTIEEVVSPASIQTFKTAEEGDANAALGGLTSEMEKAKLEVGLNGHAAGKGIETSESDLD